MSVFNLKNQNENLNNKIVAGLERVSQVFRILLWEKAKKRNLSPIQIQLLIFIRHHSSDKATVSYLAQEFNLTKPTISDAIKILGQKKLIQKILNTDDGRGYCISLTKEGEKVTSEVENFADPLVDHIAHVNMTDKIVLWGNISNLIARLNRLNIINVQRTCFDCKHYSIKNKNPFCNLLNQKLLKSDIRMDCPEFEVRKISNG